jgi:hypothetical protein
MATEYGFVAKSVIPCDQGIIFEYYTEDEAMNAYAQAKSVGALVEMSTPLTMIWKVNKYYCNVHQ